MYRTVEEKMSVLENTMGKFQEITDQHDEGQIAPISDEITRRIIDLEARSRPNNLIFQGITVPQGANWDTSKTSF